MLGKGVEMAGCGGKNVGNYGITEFLGIQFGIDHLDDNKCVLCCRENFPAQLMLM
jgi:hypothetical protein